MTRKLFSLLLVVLLLMQIPVLVSAEETATPMATVRSAYWTDSKVHIFTDFTGTNDPEALDVSLMLGNQVISTTKPASLANAGGTAHYLLLVDRSLSMGTCRGQILTFVKAAVKTEKTDLKFSVASFDSDYQMVDTGLETASEISSALRTITYNREDSDICGAAAWALEYLGENTLPAGDVSNLVIITDGQAWYSGSANTQSSSKTAAIQNVSAMMSAYPDIAVHTLCLGNWDAETYAVLSAGRGLHLSATSSAAARTAGAAMADYSDGLCLSTFPLPGYEKEAYAPDNMTFCVGKNLNSVGRVRNVTVAAPQTGAVVPVVPAVPELVPPATDPTEPSGEPKAPSGEATEPTEETVDPTEETVDPTEETVDPTEETVDPTEETVDPTAETAATDETADATIDATETTGAGEEPEPCPPATNWPLIAVCVVAAVAVLAAVVLVLKKSRAPADSVRMGVEVLSGRVTKLKKDYYLTEQILIGTDKRCHIVIDDPGAAPVNTRIFKQGQMIYIEDMDSPGGTLLGGMRLYSSNRLRSGDDITIGSVTLRILF